MITAIERENWIGKPPVQVVEELASHSIESKGIPDTYFWNIDENGKLKTGDGRVLEEEILKEGYPYFLEYQGLLKIQNWARDSSRGFTAWISPQHPFFYPEDSKVVVSEILSGERRIFNRSMRFDISAEDCVTLARSLGENPASPDDLRQNPIFLGNSWIHLLVALRKITDTSKVEKDIREGRDLRAKEEAIAQSREIYRKDPSLINIAVIAPQGFFGPVSVGCMPRSAFSLFSERSFKLGHFDCPRCGEAIPSGRGITTCPRCGATKEEFGSKCD